MSEPLSHQRQSEMDGVGEMWCRYRRRAGSRPSVKTARISRPSPLGDPSGLGHGLVDHNLRLVLKKGKMWDPSFNRFANTDSRLWTRTCSRVQMNWLKFRRNKFDSLSRPFHTCGTNCPSNLSYLPQGRYFLAAQPRDHRVPASGAFACPDTVSLGII